MENFRDEKSEERMLHKTKIVLEQKLRHALVRRRILKNRKAKAVAKFKKTVVEIRKLGLQTAKLKHHIKNIKYKLQVIDGLMNLLMEIIVLIARNNLE